MRTSGFCLSLLIGVILLLSSCTKDLSEDEANSLNQSSADAAKQDWKFNTFKGPQIEVGGGVARSFIILSHTGVPDELGVVFSDEALSGLATVNTPYVIPLHKKAAEATPFTHVALGWSANGHPLPGTSIGPHFDVRFFMLTLSERLAIPAPPAASLFVLPPAGFMPADYSADVPGPQIGMHWTDGSFTSPVKHEMILGSFNGQFTFVSPIVLLTELQGGQSVTSPYSQPTSFAEPGYYPTQYSYYQDEKERHYVTLSEFVWRN